MPESSFPEDGKYTLVPFTKPISTELYLQYYHRIGDDFGWTDRLQITDAELYHDINKNNAHLYSMQVDGKEIGYTELVVEKDYVELLYFGLFTSEIGQGHGDHLLNMVVQKAWSFAPQWVQLNTCELDHPKALYLYQEKGFEIVDTKTKPALT